MNNYQINRRSIAYDALYGSDIFNQLPEKTDLTDKNNNHIRRKKLNKSHSNIAFHITSNEQNNTNSIESNTNTNVLYNYRNNNDELYKKTHNINNKLNYAKYLSEFYDIQDDYNANNLMNEKFKNNFEFPSEMKEKNFINSTKGTFNKEINKLQPTKNVNQLNRIESLKSNIFNDTNKEIFNNMYYKNNSYIKKNNWNTNLDWKNSKSELQFYRDNNNVNNKISEDYHNVDYNYNRDYDSKINNFYNQTNNCIPINNQNIRNNGYNKIEIKQKNPNDLVFTGYKYQQ